MGGRLSSAHPDTLTLNPVVVLILFSDLVLIVDLNLKRAGRPEALVGKLSRQGFALLRRNGTGGNMDRWAILVVQDCGRRYGAVLALIRHRDEETLICVGEAIDRCRPGSGHQVCTARAGEVRDHEQEQPESGPERGVVFRR